MSGSNRQRQRQAKTINTFNDRVVERTAHERKLNSLSNSVQGFHTDHENNRSSLGLSMVCDIGILVLMTFAYHRNTYRPCLFRMILSLGRKQSMDSQGCYKT